MEFKISTKFSIGDIVIGFYNGSFYKFRIDNIKFTHYTKWDNTDIVYECSAVVPLGGVTFNEKFNEHELHTEDEMEKMFDNLRGL